MTHRVMELHRLRDVQALLEPSLLHHATGVKLVSFLASVCMSPRFLPSALPLQLPWSSPFVIHLLRFSLPASLPDIPNLPVLPPQILSHSDYSDP